jgi:hypothetical protein
MEKVLKRLGFPDYSYRDAFVLYYNPLRARKLAKNAINRKMNSKKFLALLQKNDEVRELLFDSDKLDVNIDSEFLKYIETMEIVLDLLGVPMRIL